MTRDEFLEQARICVCGEREQDYGSTEDNFETVGLLWTIYLRAAHPGIREYLKSNIGLSRKDVAMMMSLLKIARAAVGDNPDNFVDLAGYAACAGEIVTNTAAAKGMATEKRDDG